MIYLLAKYTLLFLLTAALGFLLGHWWSRRNFVDVSESFADQNEAKSQLDASNWKQLWQRFDAIPQPKDADLTRVYERIDGVASAIASIPAPEAVSLSNVESELNSLAERVARIPAPQAPKDPDFRPLIERIEKLERGIGAIPTSLDLTPISARIEKLEGEIRNIPRPSEQKEIDLQPVRNELSAIRNELKALPKNPVDLLPVNSELHSIRSELKALPKKDVDLQPVKSELQSLRSEIKGLPKKDIDLQPVKSELQSLRSEIKGLPRKDVDLRPVTQQIGTLEKRVSSIRPPEKVDLKPVDSRLRQIESEIGKLGKKLARPTQSARTVTKSSTRTREKTSRPASTRTKAKRQAKRSEPRILSAALYGKKDDLKQISGVGPKLEKMLNKNGVYYFWQVASWSRTDVNDINSRLEGFQGRISRDNWVTQAKKLRRTPGAAQTPAS